MAAKRILALNIGSSQVTLAEFKVSAGKSPVLVQYGSAPLGVEPDSDADASAFIIDALRAIMREKAFHPAPLLMSVSGQAVFPRFVKLPPVAKDKILQMVRYEAEQNVPFPIEEVVWDYQLIGDASDGEQSAMIVAVKTETVAALTSCVQAVGLEPEIVDVAPLAIANCAFVSYPGLEGCTMVLDMGARSTNLIFLEEGRVFYRTIPVAGNTITQEIAKTFQIDFRAAEQMKREKGFVALGGTYASEDETADKLSKVIRNVVTRLHAEINRSVNFYRSQQGGSVPSRVLLTGGSSVISHIDTFFREKMKVEVDYLNPFESVDIGNLDADKVGADFYGLCEVIGLAMRKSAPCLVETNLMPPALIQKKTFRKRIPFLAVGALCILAGVGLMGLGARAQLGAYTAQRDDARAARKPFEARRAEVSREIDAASAVVADIDAYAGLIRQRTTVLQVVDSLRGALLDGMWLVSVEPVFEEGAISKLAVAGRGFIDKLRKAEESAGQGVATTAVEIFRNRLAAQPAFTEDAKAIKIRYQRDVAGLSAKVKEFSLEIPLAPGYVMGKAGK